MRILWLKTELLHPLDKGGKIRTYFMLRELKKTHHITYVTLDDGTAALDAVRMASDYCHELIRVSHRAMDKWSLAYYTELLKNLGSRLPYAVDRYRSAEFTRRVAERVRAGGVDLLVCDFLVPSINISAELHCPTVLFQHNVEALIWRRHAQIAHNPFVRLYLHQQWLRMQAYERTVCRRFDAVVAVSSDDREIIRGEYGVSEVYDIPTGVDTAYFLPDRAIEPDPFHVVFTGSMDWLPNDDAMWYFVQEILPLIRATIPDVRLTIVGRNPLPRLQHLTRTDPRIVITGRVEDVRPYMDRASAYIIPLRIGGGTRLKVFEAMAMELPIVSTSIGVEGLGVVDGEDALIADTPQHFAECVVRLLKEEAFAIKLGQQAAAKVRREFGWERVACDFERICQKTLAKHARHRRSAASA